MSFKLLWTISNVGNCRCINVGLVVLTMAAVGTQIFFFLLLWHFYSLALIYRLSYLHCVSCRITIWWMSSYVRMPQLAYENSLGPWKYSEMELKVLPCQVHYYSKVHWFLIRAAAVLLLLSNYFCFSCIRHFTACVTFLCISADILHEKIARSPLTFDIGKTSEVPGKGLEFCTAKQWEPGGWVMRMVC